MCNSEEHHNPLENSIPCHSCGKAVSADDIGSWGLFICQPGFSSWLQAEDYIDIAGEWAYTCAICEGNISGNETEEDE